LSPSSEQLEDASLDALAPQFVVGCDLGQAHDPSAVCVVKKIDGTGRRPIFQVGHLERLPLNTPYPGVIAHVGRLLARLKGPAELVIDYTGVGRPVFDMFVAHGMSPIGVSITAGDATTHEGFVYKVPKLVLVSRVQALLHSGQLKINKDLAEAPALVEELQSFRAQVTDAGYWRFGARSGKHDDLLLALAICLWRSFGDGMESAGLFEYYRQTYGNGGERAAEPQAAEPPPEPLPPDPFDFYSFGTSATPTDVVLRAPGHVSAATGLSGKAYLPDARGLFTVTAEDARPLIGAGWQRASFGPHDPTRRER
jgi:hypothetical protein